MSPRSLRHSVRRTGAGLVLLVGAAVSASAGPFDDAGYDPALMSAWATSVDEIVRGPLDIAQPLLGTASFGVGANALGPATADNMDVVSLGDGGHATLYFETGIGDGPGDDFAVYENGFFFAGGLFAEFAFVEVSTDGMIFARLPAETVHTATVPSGGGVDPTDYGNFAGDQPLGVGTGFDLADLAGDPAVTSGDVDLNDIQYVRVVDVIGDGSILDSTGQPVYDPLHDDLPHRRLRTSRPSACCTCRNRPWGQASAWEASP